MDINDIASERYKYLKFNDKDIDDQRPTINDERRTHLENEALAERLRAKFEAPTWNPYLAVCYSGIPQNTIERHMATAMELGREPAKLFMHLISREPQWQHYKNRVANRGANHANN